MPYFDTSRRIPEKRGGAFQDKVFIGTATSKGFYPRTINQGIERCYSYRTGYTYTNMASKKRLTGKEIRDLIYQDKDFYLDDVGGIIVSGERASDSIRFPLDNGHNFRLLRGVHHKGLDFRDLKGGAANPADRLIGPVWLVPKIGLPAQTVPTWDDSAESNSLYQRANRALVKLAPMAPSAGLIRALGELRKDGLPRLTGLSLARAQHSAIGFAAAAGGEYLNYQFALKPTLKDLGMISNTILNVYKIMEPYQRMLLEERITVHKRGKLLEDKSIPYSGVWDVALNMGQFPISGWANYYDVYAKFFKKNSTTSSRWAVRPGVVTYTSEKYAYLECEFMFYLEDLTKFLENTNSLLGKLQAVLGTELTVQTVYDLTPWTWLTGWFSDLSGILGRAEYFATHDVVLKYGYVMYEYKTSMIAHTDLPYYFLNGKEYLPKPYVQEWTSKCRWRATPYGFGLNVSDFSPTKWAILGALGATRLPGVLHLRE